MDRLEWQERYQKQCYMPAAAEYLDEILSGITEHKADIKRELTGQVDAFFKSLGKLQENGRFGQIRTICISFPYTSLACGEPYLLMEVYPGQPFMEDAEAAAEFKSSWLFPEWEAFLTRLQDATGDQGMNSIIHKPYIRAHAWGLARVILRIAATAAKYHLYEAEEMDSFRQLQKTEDFTLYFGEYMDWQRPVLAIREAVDIFLCEEDTDLRFGRFQGAWYEDKVFEGLDLGDCRFYDCTFHNCRFTDVSLQDARILGGTFMDCSFEQMRLEGARFDGCKFEEVSMREIHTNSFAAESPARVGMQGMTEFISCSFQTAEFVCCDCSGGDFRNCRMENVKTVDSVFPEGFLIETME